MAGLLRTDFEYLTRGMIEEQAVCFLANSVVSSACETYYYYEPVYSEIVR